VPRFLTTPVGLIPPDTTLAPGVAKLAARNFLPTCFTFEPCFAPDLPDFPIPDFEITWFYPAYFAADLLRVVGAVARQGGTALAVDRLENQGKVYLQGKEPS